MVIFKMKALLAACKPLIWPDFHKSFNDTRTKSHQLKSWWLFCCCNAGLRAVPNFGTAHKPFLFSWPFCSCPGGHNEWIHCAVLVLWSKIHKMRRIANTTADSTHLHRKRCRCHAQHYAYTGIRAGKGRSSKTSCSDTPIHIFQKSFDDWLEKLQL